jgi:hypothetical protein
MNMTIASVYIDCGPGAGGRWDETEGARLIWTLICVPLCWKSPGVVYILGHYLDTRVLDS